MASKVEIIFDATDEASPIIDKVNGELGISEEQLNKASRGADSTKMSWTELSSVINIGKEAFAIANQVMDETVGKFQAYAEQVRALSAISGQNAEDTSRFIQVLDDWQISAEDATIATKALTKEGLAPNIETIAQLSDQYLSITDTQQRNEFVLRNLGKAGLEWNQILSQGSSALREQSDSVMQGLILKEKDIAAAEKLRLAQDDLNDSLDAMKIQIGMAVVPALNTYFEKTQISTEAINRLKEAGKFTTIQSKEYADMLKVVTEEYEANKVAMDTNKTSMDAAAMSAEELAAAQQKISDANNGLVSSIQSMQSADDNFTKNSKALAEQRTEIEEKFSEAKTRGYEKTVGEYAGYQKQLDDIKQKEADIAAERDRQSLQMVSNILLQKLQIGGLTDKEFEEFAKQQKAWGLWSDDVVKKSKAAWQEADKITQSINNIPTERTIDFISRYTTIGNPTVSSVEPMHAHASGGSFLIPDSYGNEGFRMGNGDTASAGERITITPRGGDSSAGIDYDRLARVLRDAMLQVSR